MYRKERIKIAKKMLKKGIEASVIIQVTGLDIKEINKIKEKIKM